ncbi:hypothetical protein HZS_3820 [Henneguya salminicola]|nr:hypothetical protein HZS_3820 [Henneguya salminicola]
MKIDILVSLINSENWKYILAEFSIYSTYPQFEFAAYSIRKLTECALKEPKTVKSIVWLVSEYCRELPHLAPDMLRLAARSFCNDITNVKHQTLNLAARLVAINDSETVHALADYVFNLAKYDQNHDIRDRHRFLVNILEFQKSEKIDKNLIKRVLFSPKPVPNVSYENIENTQTQEIMTLSFFLNREITGYRNIPEYSNVEIDPSVRIVMKETLNEKYEISSEKSESSYYSEEEEDSENEDKDTETEPETEEEEEEEELRYN